MSAARIANMTVPHRTAREHVVQLSAAEAARRVADAQARVSRIERAEPEPEAV